MLTYVLRLTTYDNGQRGARGSLSTTAGLPEVGFCDWQGQFKIIENRTAIVIHRYIK